jgi:hypothetical protein
MIMTVWDQAHRARMFTLRLRPVPYRSTEDHRTRQAGGCDPVRRDGLGIFTPTEAGAVAVAYALIVGLFVYWELSWEKLPRLLLRSCITSAAVMMAIGATTALAWVITLEGVSFMLVERSDPAADDEQGRVPADPWHLPGAALGGPDLRTA